MTGKDLRAAVRGGNFEQVLLQCGKLRLILELRESSC